MMTMSKGNMLILRGRKGKKIFDHIKNDAPTIPYERLRAESEAFKQSLRKARENGTI